MFAGMFNRRNQGGDQTASNCWVQLPIGFKYLFVASLAIFVIDLISPIPAYYLPNYVEMTVESFQIWRLFTSFLINGASGWRTLLAVLLRFLWLYSLLADYEEKYSTAWTLMEIIVQVFTSNLLGCVIGYPLMKKWLVFASFLDIYGLLPLIMIFAWRKAGQNPNGHSRFCNLPFFFPNKYLPWVYFLIIVIFGNQVFPTLISCGLGFVQSMVLKRNLIRLPLSFYRRIDTFMPRSIYNSPSYTRVTDVQANLRYQCGTLCFERVGPNQSAFEQQPRHQPQRLDPFSSPSSIAINQNNVIPNKIQFQKVEVLGGGVSIGGNANEFKGFWKNKGDENTTSDSNKVVDANLIDDENKKNDDLNASSLSNKPFVTNLESQQVMK